MPMYNVPRCQHLKVNGTQCGSPALKRNRFCFFHKRFQEERIKLSCDRVRHNRASLYLPVLEDANSIQVSLMQIMRLLASRQIDSKTASLLLYALQTASVNLRQISFEPNHLQDVVSTAALSTKPASAATSGPKTISPTRKKQKKKKPRPPPSKPPKPPPRPKPRPKKEPAKKPPRKPKTIA